MAGAFVNEDQGDDEMPIFGGGNKDKMSQLEAELAELRAMLTYVIKPEVELRATFRFIKSEDWDWLFSMLNNTASPAAAVWITALSKLRDDVNRQTVSSTLVTDLRQSIEEAKRDYDRASTDILTSNGIDLGFDAALKAFDDYLNQFPLLKAQVADQEAERNVQT